MNILSNVFLGTTRSLMLVSLLAFASAATANNLTPLVDDFSDEINNRLSQPRQFINDTVAGGNTTVQQMVSDGIIRVKGDIVPPRGQPGWASSVLPLAAVGINYDASQYQGVRLLVKLNKGNLTLSANSNEITNFDFHSAPVVVTSDGEFHEVKVAFASMKRGWSEQTALNTATLNSLSVIAYSLQPAGFDFELREVSFY
ncbi:Complex I intermediate-associated protein 30 (CIA30) [Arsukibacterium tuosuense]|uniref:Complex I intermediate-associated protein 30 (CIA30) n=1 Tax=Arsukibacterium tuosuense TaxID=1323745 RepID=A0A285ITB9_9GAMM|nr:CIA30 family protein [Arsukibacterium tuosuense]SNY51265.1 Complex I intermediate-associated protein 30 (CIA30) [Arsukibacterium tuosuense]